MYIQMVTALVLQLIQCVVHLPNDKDTFEECDKVGEQADMQKQPRKQIYSLYKHTFRHIICSPFFLLFLFFLGRSRCVDNQLVWDGNENSTKLPLSLPQKVITVPFNIALKYALCFLITKLHCTKLYFVTLSIY